MTHLHTLTIVSILMGNLNITPLVYHSWTPWPTSFELMPGNYIFTLVDDWQTYPLLNVFSNTTSIFREYACVCSCKCFKCSTQSRQPKFLFFSEYIMPIFKLYKTATYSSYTLQAGRWFSWDVTAQV